jgi:hypothetical protein
MCHGSRKMNEATNHMTYVDPSDTIIEKNVLFVNSSLTEKLFEATSVWIDFTVTNTAAKDRYNMMKIQKYTMVM